MTFPEMLHRVLLSQTPLKPPFLIHRPNGLPLLVSQWQRFSANLPDVAWTIQIRRLLWFTWNWALPIDVRWWSYLKWLISSEAIPCWPRGLTPTAVIIASMRVPEI